MISDIAPPAAGTGSAGQPMRFSVDGWDPSYGASLELEEQLQESTATVAVDVELPASQVAGNRRHDEPRASRGDPLRRRCAPH